MGNIGKWDDGRNNRPKLTDIEKQENKFNRLIKKEAEKSNTEIKKTRQDFIDDAKKKERDK